MATDTDRNRRWILASRPAGMAAESNFARRDEPRPAVAAGQLLVRTLYLSVDPAMRGWMSEDPDYVAPIPLGSVMPAGGLGQVVESRHDDFQAGDLVSGLLGWQDYHRTDGRGPSPLSTVEAVHPLPLYLGVLGGTGPYRVLRHARSRPTEGGRDRRRLRRGRRHRVGSRPRSPVSPAAASSALRGAPRSAAGSRTSCGSTAPSTTRRRTSARVWPSCAPTVWTSTSTTSAARPWPFCSIA